MENKLGFWGNDTNLSIEREMGVATGGGRGRLNSHVAVSATGIGENCPGVILRVGVRSGGTVVMVTRREEVTGGVIEGAGASL